MVERAKEIASTFHRRRRARGRGGAAVSVLVSFTHARRRSPVIAGSLPTQVTDGRGP
jgi:hypothetical protein